MSVDSEQTLAEVLADLDKSIHESGAHIHSNGLPVLRAYPTELKLLLQNLIINAIKFRHSDRRPEIDIEAVPEPASWKFIVTDNGIGIEPQFLERIFIIFQRLHSRTKYDGSGIGLAHGKKIAELHGGRIWAESTPGRGSRFYFTISRDL